MTDRRQYWRDYYNKNRERYKPIRKKYWEDNKDFHHERQKDWREENSVELKLVDHGGMSIAEVRERLRTNVAD